MLRIATFALNLDTDAAQNLSQCLPLLERAAQLGAELVIVPSLSRTRDEPGDVEGDLFMRLRESAKQHNLHILVGASLTCAESKISTSGLLFAPDGQLLQRTDAQLVPVDQRELFAPGEHLAQVLDTALGRIASCIGADGCGMEQVRALALAEAELVCLLFATQSAEDAWLHAAARAVENRMFVVASAPEAGPEGEGLLFKTKIFGPDGVELSAEPVDGLSVYSIQLAAEQPAVDVARSVRRPELYRALLNRPRECSADQNEAVNVAIVSHVDAGDVEAAIDSAASFVREIATDGAQVIVLPELFCFAGGSIEDPELAAGWFGTAARRIAEACEGTAAHVITSLVEEAAGGFAHMGVVIGHAGIVARSAQLHVSASYAFAQPARRFEVLPMPWGRLGLVLADDVLVPEVARSLALLGADILVALGPSRSMFASHTVRAAALENGVPVAFAQRATTGVSLLLQSGRAADTRESDSEQAVLRAVLYKSADRQMLMTRVQHVLPALLARPPRLETSQGAPAAETI